MVISNPPHWKEVYGDDKGDKWDKIVEMISELNTPTVAPVAHKTSHQNGGGDEISVAGLSGLLADPQTPAAHSPASHEASHRSGGGDALTDVAFLSGNQTINGIKTFGSIPVLPGSDPTLNNEATRKGYVDYEFVARPSTPYLSEYNAINFVTVDLLDSPTIRVSSVGVYQSTTGTVYQYYGLFPPDWFIRWAEVNSKIIKATEVVVHYANHASASYLTRFIAYYSDGHSNTYTTLHDDTTDHGNGNTTFQDITYNITDSVAMTRGDYLFVRLDFYNASANQDRMKSLDVKWSWS